MDHLLVAINLRLRLSRIIDWFRGCGNYLGFMKSLYSMDLVEYAWVPPAFNWTCIPKDRWILMAEFTSSCVTNLKDTILLPKTQSTHNLLKYVKTKEQFVDGILYFLYEHCRKLTQSALCRHVPQRVLRLSKVIAANPTVSMHFANAFTDEELAVVRLDNSKDWTIQEILPELHSAVANGANMTFCIIDNAGQARLRGNAKLWNPKWTAKQKTQKVKPNNTQLQMDSFFKVVRKTHK